MKCPKDKCPGKLTQSVRYPLMLQCSICKVYTPDPNSKRRSHHDPRR
jgi:hypothetical protein